jgi:hypothetical protein
MVSSVSAELEMRAASSESIRGVPEGEISLPFSALHRAACVAANLA